MTKLRYKDGEEWKSIAPSQKEFDDFKDTTSSQLADKAKKDEVRMRSEVINPEDLSENTLALVTGQGTVNLLTIPQNESVTPDTLAPITDALNLYADPMLTDTTLWRSASSNLLKVESVKLTDTYGLKFTNENTAPVSLTTYAVFYSLFVDNLKYHGDKLFIEFIVSGLVKGATNSTTQLVVIPYNSSGTEITTNRGTIVFTEDGKVTGEYSPPALTHEIRFRFEDRVAAGNVGFDTFTIKGLTIRTPNYQSHKHGVGVVELSEVKERVKTLEEQEAVSEGSITVEKLNSEVIALIESKPLTRRIPVMTPSGYSWTNHPLVGKLFTDGQGNFEIVDFDVADYQHVGAGKTYYVDVVNGSNANDGLTLATALKTIKAAIDKADVDIIMLAQGVYTSSEGFNGSGVAKNLTVKAIPGHDVRVSCHENLTYTVEVGYTNVYKATLAGIQRVFDASLLDYAGDYTELKNAASVAEVESTPGSYFLSGSDIYLHTHNNRVPDNSIRAYLGKYNVRLTRNFKYYLEGISFEGGYSGAVRAEENVNGAPYFYAKDCSFKYSTGNSPGAFVALGAIETILQNCKASKSARDGFNYHQFNAESLRTKSLEINCVAYDNGLNDSGNTHNGSTTHDGMIVMRVNGVYYHNKGPNLADVNDNTFSWNINCLCFDSQATVDTQNCDFQVQSGAAKMWVDSCHGYSSTYTILVDSATGEIYKRNVITDIENAGSGVLARY